MPLPSARARHGRRTDAAHSQQRHHHAQRPDRKSVVNVVSSPFFAVTGPDGSFRISGLPPGEYTLVALHEKLGSQEIQVKVGAKESKSDVAFHFKPAQP
jgi:uncharacterized protein (DUF2141 family)